MHALKCNFVHAWNLKRAAPVMAWFWALNLFFFPVWLFGKPTTLGRFEALALIVGWIILSTIGLRLWVRKSSADNPLDLTLPTGSRRQNQILLAGMLLIGLLNLPTLFYPLTSSGDEAYHAAIFRGTARNLINLAAHLPQGIIFPVAVLFALAALAAWLLYLRKRLRLPGKTKSWLILLVVTALIYAPLIWLIVDRLIAQGVLYTPELEGLVRFQPFSKFIWLPFSLCCHQSIVLLRLPAWLCWLAGSWILYRTTALHRLAPIPVLAGLLLLVLPGMFTYAHLVYLTTPMLLFWCAALFFYAAYHETGKNHFLILTALMLNIGCLIRLETAYLTAGLIIHYSLTMIKQHRLTFDRWLDIGALGWMGTSLALLWGLVTPPIRNFNFGLNNLTHIDHLLAAANDFPLQIGLIGLAALLWGTASFILQPKRTRLSVELLGVALATIGVSYILYTIDFIALDERTLGLLPIGRQWQTASRFLVSWSPFIALLMTEGLSRIKLKRIRFYTTCILLSALLAQATFWAAPFSLPDFTSLRLRPNTEHPYLPAETIVKWTTQETSLSTVNKLVPEILAAAYYISDFPSSEHWTILANPPGNATPEDLADYCSNNDIGMVILPLVWMDGVGHWDELGRAVRDSERFTSVRIFDYLGQEAVVAAQPIAYKGYQEEQ
jgi:hypothetical protein